VRPSNTKIHPQGVQKVFAQGPTSKINNPPSPFNHQNDPLNALKILQKSRIHYYETLPFL
jgi:hypothetical protein